jgi:hypothetical protein
MLVFMFTISFGCLASDGFEYDEEWLAIFRSTYKFLSTGRRRVNLPTLERRHVER